MIDNDFHERKDLAPNLCALFVEESYRHQGIARRLLDYVVHEVGLMNIERLYLVTEHATLYEKCGWEFVTWVKDDEGIPLRLYMISTSTSKACDTR